MTPSPLSFHDIPAPHSSVAPASNPSAGSQDPAQMGQHWKPTGTFGEAPVATIARFASRLIDRQTGKAHSADELRIQPGTPVGVPVAATATLTGTTIAVGDFVTIGDIPYEFAEAPLDVYRVLVGASDSESLDNLIAAINGAAGEGTTYGTGTAANELVTAEAGEGDTMLVVAVEAGVAGNSIAVSHTLTAGAWSSPTLTGGADVTPGVVADQRIDGDFLYVVAAIENGVPVWRKIAHSAL